MEQNTNGYRFKDYNMWESTVQTPYDYERNGLVNKIVSKPIHMSKNPVLKIVLQIYESSIVFVLKYIDVLKNFKNIHWKNW